MASAKRRDEPRAIILNDSTRPFWIDQVRFAEHLFQLMRDDRPSGSAMNNDEWKRLLGRLSAACRKLATLLSKYMKVIAPNVEQETPASADFAEQTDFSGLLISLDRFLDESKKSVGGLDNGLKMLAEYFDGMRRRRRGRPTDVAVNMLIQLKLRDFMFRNPGKKPCSWNSSRKQYTGPFLDEMGKTLKKLKYKYQSRDALAERIEAVKARILILDSPRKLETSPVLKERRRGGDRPRR